MQLGFVSAILPDCTLTELAEFAADCRYPCQASDAGPSRLFDCVEIMCWPVGKAERRYAGVTHVDVTALSAAQAAEINQQLAEAGLVISSLGYYPNPLAPDPAEAEAAVAHLRRVIQAAPKLGVQRVTSFIGRNWKESLDDNWPRMLSTWRPLVQLAEDHGVKIGIENCPMLFTDDEWPGGKNLAISPAIWRRLFADIPSPSLGLNYDPSHLVWQQMDYLKPIREFADRLHHVHAKDVRIDRQRLDDVGILATPLQYHTPKLPGLGEVNWGMFFSELGDAGYDGPVCIEVEDRAYEGSLQRRQESLRQSGRFLRNFM